MLPNVHLASALKEYLCFSHLVFLVLVHWSVPQIIDSKEANKLFNTVHGFRLSLCSRNTVLRHWYVVKASSWPFFFFWMVHSLLVFDSGSNLPPTRCRWSQHDPALGRKNILRTLLLSCCVLVCLCVRGQQHRRMSFKMFSGLYSTQSLFERNKYISVVTERTFCFWLLVG